MQGCCLTCGRGCCRSCRSAPPSPAARRCRSASTPPCASARVRCLRSCCGRSSRSMPPALRAMQMMTLPRCAPCRRADLNDARLSRRRRCRRPLSQANAGHSYRDAIASVSSVSLFAPVRPHLHALSVPPLRFFLKGCSKGHHVMRCSGTASAAELSGRQNCAWQHVWRFRATLLTRRDGQHRVPHCSVNNGAGRCAECVHATT